MICVYTASIRLRREHKSSSSISMYTFSKTLQTPKKTKLAIKIHLTGFSANNTDFLRKIKVIDFTCKIKVIKIFTLVDTEL